MEEFAFYKGLDEKTFHFLKMRLQPIEVPAGTLLFSQGDVCDAIIFLTKGEVRVFTQNEEGEEKDLYTLKPGKQCIVNTASTLSQSKAIATSVAQTDIEGYILDMYSVKDFAKMNDAYCEYLFSLYSLTS